MTENPQELDLDEVRAHAQSLVERIKMDDALRERLIDDPEATLKAEGFDERVIGDLSRELAGGPEVEGHLGGRCIPLSCLIPSCIVTLLETA